MQERGIIFNSEMVRAILDGRKTQTRRIIKPQPPAVQEPDSVRLGFDMDYDRFFLVDANGGPMWHLPFCPYGQVGDILYVRETFNIGGGIGCPGLKPMLHVTYNTDNTMKLFNTEDIPSKSQMKFGNHPSIHMPKWASRIWLEITGVRVERVQEITGDDALAEGIASNRGNDEKCRRDFAMLWDSLNTKRGYGWDVNPWVWVLTFKRIER